MQTEPGLTIGHTIVAGDMTRGGTCNRIALYDGGEVKAKAYLDVGRLVETDPATGRTVHQTSNIAADLATSDAMILSHGHDDHITGLPAVVAAVRRQGGTVPPIYLEPATKAILAHEFAFQNVSMKGLQFEFIEPGKPFTIGYGEQALKVTPASASHTMPTLSFVFQTQEENPVTMVWESDVKNDPTVMLRKGNSIDEIRQMAGGGPIHNLATSVYGFSFDGHNTKDADMAGQLARNAAGYDHVVFVSYGGSPDRSVFAASVAAAAGSDHIVYAGTTHDIYLDALRQAGYDLGKAASPEHPFAFVPAREAKATGATSFTLCDTNYGDVRGILEGSPDSPQVPLGAKTLFAFIGATRDTDLLAEIAVTGSNIFTIPLVSAHAHRADAMERIQQYDALSVTPLHAARAEQELFVQRMKEDGRDATCALPGQEYIIGHEGRELSPVQRLYQRLELPGSSLITVGRPEASREVPVATRTLALAAG